jgi:hypothetical protein
MVRLTLLFITFFLFGSASSIQSGLHWGQKSLDKDKIRLIGFVPALLPPTLGRLDHASMVWVAPNSIQPRLGRKVLLLEFRYESRPPLYLIEMKQQSSLTVVASADYVVRQGYFREIATLRLGEQFTKRYLRARGLDIGILGRKDQVELAMQALQELPK